MGRMQTFQQFLTTQSQQISVLGFLINFVIVLILSFILSRLYIKYGHSLSNRRMFANNFMLIATTTMFIIAVIKSSLALSLGLVGALSIVRFRAAIKEPEELAYLFLNIAIGLGLGADQRIITIVAFLAISIVIWLKNIRYGSDGQRHMYLTVASSPGSKINLDKIINVLNNFCEAVNLRRFDETKDLLEALFLVEYSDSAKLMECRSELYKLDESLKITFLDNRDG